MDDDEEVTARVARRTWTDDARKPSSPTSRSSRPQERRDIEADLDDLGSMRTVFSPPGREGRRDRVPGLRREPLLRVGAAARQPRAHAARAASPACTSPRSRSSRTSTSSGTTARGTSTRSPIPASSRTGGSRSRGARGARRHSATTSRSAPRCGRTLGDRAALPRAARSRLRRARRPRLAGARGLRALLNARSCAPRVEGAHGALSAGAARGKGRAHALDSCSRSRTRKDGMQGVMKEGGCQPARTSIEKMAADMGGSIDVVRLRFR